MRDGPRGFGQDSSCPALLRWSPKTCHVTRTGLSPSADRLSRRFRFLTCSLWKLLQPRMRLDAHGLGSSPFARHYSGNRFFLSSPAGTKMFQFPAFAALARCTHFMRAGFPIRTPPDHFPFADPRSFSQLTTSFLASGSLGIPRSPFSSFSRVNRHFCLSRLFFFSEIVVPQFFGTDKTRFFHNLLRLI